MASTKSVTEVIFLTKKAGEPKSFCRVKNFDILNTEVRAQLFSHAFGYEQLAADFGDLSTQAADSQSLSPRDTPMMAEYDYERRRGSRKGRLVLPTPIEVDKQHVTLILRKFTIVRFRTLDEESGEEVEESQYAYVAFYQSPRLLEQHLLQIQI